MDVLKLRFLLLLTLCDSKDFRVERVWKKKEAIPVCDISNTTDFISMVSCDIRRERSSVEPCSLIYQYDGKGYGFTQRCDSSFTLTGNNQTIFLLPLAAAHNLNITCTCSHLRSMDILHLNITVEDSEEEVGDLTTTNLPWASVSVSVFLILTSVMLVFIYRKLQHRKQQDPLRNPPDMGDEDVEPYSTFICTDNGLYSLAQLPCSHNNGDNSDMTA